ncbi:unnamed protein product [Lathyrus sativus]|nr:unnamed protein product [Lathyrus sativus]
MSLFRSIKDDPPNWFEFGLVKKVETCLQASFWKDHWIGSIPLKTRFQRLFPIFQRQDDIVGEIGSWVDGRISWNLGWRRPFFVYEESMVSDFFSRSCRS